jgi:hypothetical protein
MSDRVNYGIVGNVSAQNVAVGTNARVDASGADARFAQHIEALLSAIAVFDGDPDVGRQLAVAGDQVAQALAQPAAETDRALSWLSRIASVAGPAGAIASAAAALDEAVRAII